MSEFKITWSLIDCEKAESETLTNSPINCESLLFSIAKPDRYTRHEITFHQYGGGYDFVKRIIDAKGEKANIMLTLYDKRDFSVSPKWEGRLYISGYKHNETPHGKTLTFEVGTKSELSNSNYTNVNYK